MSDIQLFHGDCLEIMPQLPDGSCDCIICDMPYSTTACKWDVQMPLAPLWEQYERLIRDDGAIALFATQPFTTTLIASKMDWFRYMWYWRKGQGSNFQLANIQPLRVVEDICIFSKAKSANGANPTLRYFPILKPRAVPSHNGGGLHTVSLLNRNNMKQIHKTYYTHHPTNVLEYKRVYGREKVHPTQKPVDLLSYLIRTYTREGETVLDNCMGSGSTGVACVETGRNFIGIEKSETFFNIAKERIERRQKQGVQGELF